MRKREGERKKDRGREIKIKGDNVRERESYDMRKISSRAPWSRFVSNATNA